MGERPYFFREHETAAGGERIPITIAYPLRYLTEEAKKRFIVFAYGGKRSFSRWHLRRFLEFFAEAGFAALAFDYRGMCEPREAGTLDFGATGLHTRIEDLAAVLQEVRRTFRPDEITLYGQSMGGYVAAHLSEEIDNLILAAPAAYRSLARINKIPFGPEFTKLLREPRSWEYSDAFLRLFIFKKPLLILRFEHDKVIPEDVITKYYAKAGSADKSIVSLPGYSHGDNFSPESDFAKARGIAEAVLHWLQSRSKVR